MSYTTPHRLWEYMLGASLRINHGFYLQCQRRSERERKAILAATREIDLCATLASYFGTSCHLAAQGTTEPDLKNDAPVFKAEVKYPFPNKTSWAQVQKDWNWLLGRSNTNAEFNKRAFLLFWPSTSLYNLTACISVPKGHGTQYSLLDYAPLSPYATPVMPARGVNQRLQFRQPTSCSAVGLQMPNGKRVCMDIVGELTHPVWCAIYTRLTPDEYAALANGCQNAITDDPITL